MGTVKAKVVAGSFGAGTGYGLTQVVDWLVLDVWHKDVPPLVMGVFDFWIVALVALLAGYAKRETVPGLVYTDYTDGVPAADVEVPA